MGKDVIIACDYNSAKETYEFLEMFPEGEKPFVKIGMELFYAEGPAIVREIKARGHKVFLDLKCHDIPNTVKKTMKVIGGLGVDITNVHAAGTKAMMKAALEGLREAEAETILIAVTQLTSTDEETMRREILIDKPLAEVVARYSLSAKEAGLGGVVCSPHEAAGVHELCGGDFVTVTPGIRMEDSAFDDQKRIMTPEAAKVAGSDYIVVGRPITQADNPVEAYRRCINGFVG